MDAVRFDARRYRRAVGQGRDRRQQLSCRPATARSAASCRRSGSNTATRSSACIPGARRRSSRSRSLSCARMRPQIGKLPNEDAQSLIFDDSNLFSVNKFSGWDRIEGGTRLNAGIQYTAQFNQRRLRQCAVRPVLPAVRAELVRGRRHGQYRPQQRACQAALGLCGARRLSAGQHLLVHLPLPAGRRHVHDPPRRSRGSRELRSLAVHRALRQLRRPARDRLPRAPAGHDRPGHLQVHAELERARRRRATISRPISSTRPHRARLHRRLLCHFAQLHDRL